jgi:hypothetical protein
MFAFLQRKKKKIDRLVFLLSGFKQIDRQTKHSKISFSSRNNVVENGFKLNAIMFNAGYDERTLEKINDVMQIASWILCKLWKLMSHLNYKH